MKILLDDVRQISEVVNSVDGVVIGAHVEPNCCLNVGWCGSAMQCQQTA